MEKTVGDYDIKGSCAASDHADLWAILSNQPALHNKQMSHDLWCITLT